MNHHNIRSAIWLRCVMSPRGIRQTAEEIAGLLAPHKNSFDTIAFRGLSGSLIVPTLAGLMKKEFLAVRKDGESSHSRYPIEGNYACQKFIIVDDLIHSGKTIKEISDSVKAEIQSSMGHTPELVGIALYNGDPYSEESSYRTVLGQGFENTFMVLKNRPFMWS